MEIHLKRGVLTEFLPEQVIAIPKVPVFFLFIIGPYVN